MAESKNREEEKKKREKESDQAAEVLYTEKVTLLQQAAASNVAEKIRILIDKMPARTNNQAIIDKFVVLFQQIIAQAKDKENSIVELLNDAEATNLYDFINKSFEHISRGKFKEDRFFSNKLFKLHGLIVAKFGKSVILRAICKQRSFVTSIDNFPNENQKDPNLQ